LAFLIASLNSTTAILNRISHKLVKVGVGFDRIAQPNSVAHTNETGCKYLFQL